MSLDIKAEAAKLQQLYRDDASHHTFNALILGESGTGKTYLARTCRKPVLIDSFDPGGAKGLRPWIERGEVLVDARYEADDPLNPTAYLAWRQEFDRRLKEGFFQHFGTYVLDSATTWSKAIMNFILKKAGIPGQAPRYTHDYTPQKLEIENMIYRMLKLPCDFILTGHLELNKEEGSGQMKFRFMTTGKGAITIPLLFDEQYVTVTKESSQGVAYKLLTAHTGMYVARTRIGAGKFSPYEEQDIKALLRKCGLDDSDKPLLV